MIRPEPSSDSVIAVPPSVSAQTGGRVINRQRELLVRGRRARPAPKSSVPNGHERELLARKAQRAIVREGPRTLDRALVERSKQLQTVVVTRVDAVRVDPRRSSPAVVTRLCTRCRRQRQRRRRRQHRREADRADVEDVAGRVSPSRSARIVAGPGPAPLARLTGFVRVGGVGVMQRQILAPHTVHPSSDRSRSANAAAASGCCNRADHAGTVERQRDRGAVGQRQEAGRPHRAEHRRLRGRSTRAAAAAANNAKCDQFDTAAAA